MAVKDTHRDQTSETNSMVDENLIKGIHATLPRTGCIALDQKVADRMANAMAQRYAIDSSKLRWWEGMGVPSRTTQYQPHEGLNLIRKLVDGNPQVVMFVTDDEPPPWPAVRGPLDQVLFIVSEQRFFEYFLVPESLEWLIFDTHDNALVASSTL